MMCQVTKEESFFVGVGLGKPDKAIAFRTLPEAQAVAETLLPQFKVVAIYKAIGNGVFLIVKSLVSC